MTVSPQALVAQRLESLLSGNWAYLSSASLADLLSAPVTHGIEDAASYAYHVHDSVIAATWQGAKAVR